MVPPDSLFGLVDTWVGVFAVSAAVLALSSLILYRRVFRLILLGRPSARFDQLGRRILGACR